MTKQELMKKCDEIILKTNGSNEDYVVTLCQISMLIKELDEPKEEECVLDEFCTCSNCGASQKDIRKKYSNYCSNCGRKIKKGE